LSDPGIQADVLTAGDGYVRTGREDVKRSLIDLIALRCGVETGSLQGAVISEAIETVRRNTARGITIATVLFLLTRVINHGLNSVAELEAWGFTNIGPHVHNLPLSAPEYEYLASTPAAYTEIGEFHIPDLLGRKFPGLFNRGVEEGSLSEAMLRLREGHPELFTPCLQDSSKVQPAALNLFVAETKCRQSDLPESISEEYQSLLTTTVSPSDSIRELIQSQAPTWSSLDEIVEARSELRQLRLTSVGIAIAHCNWTSTTGDLAPLSTWIPD
jgi:hypothetical protein